MNNTEQLKRTLCVQVSSISHETSSAIKQQQPKATAQQTHHTQNGIHVNTYLNLIAKQGRRYMYG